ncbi:hypothetical protein [Prauserella shujinwangii]|uniref:hypothetical protein n=1 Tax=Prauserella shujinwangii TaxID=1453103 RepID=UPI003CCB9B1B
MDTYPSLGRRGAHLQLASSEGHLPCVQRTEGGPYCRAAAPCRPARDRPDGRRGGGTRVRERGDPRLRRPVRVRRAGSACGRSRGRSATRARARRRTAARSAHPG